MKQSKSQTKQGVIPWICSVRGEKYSCYAKIKQVQGSFRSVHDHHNHNIKLCEPQKIKVRCMVSTRFLHVGSPASYLLLVLYLSWDIFKGY